MTPPDWWSFLLLGLAAWSTFQLVGDDDILDRPRRWFLRLGNDWTKEGDPVPDNYRVKWGAFITCPYCSGFWISLVWYGAWFYNEKWTMIAAAAMALRAVVVGGNKVLGRDDD